MRCIYLYENLNTPQNGRKIIIKVSKKCTIGSKKKKNDYNENNTVSRIYVYNANEHHVTFSLSRTSKFTYQFTKKLQIQTFYREFADGT